MRHFVILSIALSIPHVLVADSLYHVALDTTSLSGTSGSFDFQFDPGPLGSQAAALQILNFGGDSNDFSTAVTIGDVSGGPLPSAITLDNGSDLNDYFDALVFGTYVDFDILLSGPALNAPDGVSTSGSIFGFSAFADSLGTEPAFTTDTTNGFAVLVDVNLDGRTAVMNFSDEATVTGIAATPEPPALVLFGIGLSTQLLPIFCALKSRQKPEPAAV